MKALLLLLSPVAPHICEEIWQVQGYGEPIYSQSWPEYDEKYLVLPEVEIAVQINGKVRGRIMVLSSLSEEEAQSQLPQHETVKSLVADKQIIKLIYIKGRLLNIVVK